MDTDIVVLLQSDRGNEAPWTAVTVGTDAHIASTVDSTLEKLLFDSETSGGLLAALPAKAAEEFVRRLHDKGHAQTRIVGEVSAQGEHLIEVA